MSMSEIASADIGAMYKEFTELVPNRLVQSGLFSVMGVLFKSYPEYIGESEDTVANHLNDGGSVLLNSIHTVQPDSLVMGAFVKNEKAFRLMQGKTTIASKPEVFDWPLAGWPRWRP